MLFLLSILAAEDGFWYFIVLPLNYGRRIIRNRHNEVVYRPLKLTEIP